VKSSDRAANRPNLTRAQPLSHTPTPLARATLHTPTQGEKSARALDLTRHLISFNSADYTAWQWRWRCVRELGNDLAEERQLTECVGALFWEGGRRGGFGGKPARDLGVGFVAAHAGLWVCPPPDAGRLPTSLSPTTYRPSSPSSCHATPTHRRVADDSTKNYQLWNHRAKIAAALGPSGAAGELEFAAQALRADEKNYHAWAHRQVGRRLAWGAVGVGACWGWVLRVGLVGSARWFVGRG